MTDNELLYVLALQHIPKVGDITAKKLIRSCGSAEAVLKEKPSNLMRIEGVGQRLLKHLSVFKHLKAAEKELEFIQKENITCLFYQASDYPEKLKHCIDGPILLFQTGNVHMKDSRIISVVGTRKVTTYGISFIEKLIEQLEVYQPIIVSGFAYGTDITAHKLAMKHNLQTIGCLAHGHDQIYPRSHKKYVAQVEANGGFLTDFWSSDDFDRNNFLKRNRIIAGISEATIVIESAEKGGSLVTADIANSYDREVFAVPGRITDSQSSGCNNLIKYQQAHILTNPLDVPYILNWELEQKQEPVIQKQLFVELTEEEQRIFDYLKQCENQLLDTIAIDCDLPTFKTASILLNLELKGLVKPLPGKLFRVF